MEKKELGQWGEDRAAGYLRRRGYAIVDRNFHCRFGEIDIIAESADYVVFAEVKLRKNADFAEAREFVTVQKQRRIISTAQLWLMQSGCEKQPRFDVIEVYAPKGARTLLPEINHIKDAFR